MNAHVETLRGIATDCRRGAHEHGMTAAGVRDIASRIDLAIAALEAQGEAVLWGVKANGGEIHSTFLSRKHAEDVAKSPYPEDVPAHIVVPLYAAPPSSPAMRAVVEAGNKLLSAMDMQVKRESGEFHIPANTAKGIWDDAIANWNKAICRPEIKKLMGEGECQL